MAPQVIVLDVGNSVSEYHRIPDLKEMQNIVGGWIEGVQLPEGMYGFVNEEGLMMPLMHNDAASRVAGQPIVGPLIITGGVHHNGETLPLTDAQIEWVRIKLIGG